VIVNGKAIYSWGDISAKLWVHSIRKSFLNALIGIAVDQGKIQLTSTLQDLGIDDILPSLTAVEKTATVQELLEARSGIYHLSADDTPGMDSRRPPRGSHDPGTFWYYNNWDFNALGGIYEQQTGASIFDALFTEIALPTGMQDYTPTDGRYSYQKELSNFPGYLLDLSTRDMARLGQLYLQSGKWDGTQIVPAAWVQATTTSYSDASSTAPSGTGYGYLWWLGSPDGSGLFNKTDLGAGAFAAEGYGGHFIIVLPSRQMVVVSRADDSYFEQDPTHNDIGPNREGALMNIILGAADKR
jgi:CubicO group peptidase (beta-lactamase class C family)